VNLVFSVVLFFAKIHTDFSAEFEFISCPSLIVGMIGVKLLSLEAFFDSTMRKCSLDPHLCSSTN